MRIAFLAYHGSVHTVRWVSFFADRGHDVHVVTCGGATAPSGARPYAVHDLGPPKLGKLGYLFKVLAARRTVRRLRPDVVHAHYATSYGGLALAAGVHPLIVTGHGDDVLVAPRGLVKRLLVKAVLRHADLVTVPGEHMLEAVERLCGPDVPPIQVFQYGVETELLGRLSDERRAARGPGGARSLRIVSARPLEKRCRLDCLILGLSVLKKRGIAFTCEIIGDGPDRPLLQNLVDHEGLAGIVRFHGSVAASVVEEAMADADVSVSLAAVDGASLAVLEAMALGACPVVSDIPANRAWAVEGGAVVVAVDPDSVADGIERAARMDKVAATRRNRQLVMDRADLPTNLGRFEAVMASLCERSRAAHDEVSP